MKKTFLVTMLAVVAFATNVFATEAEAGVLGLKPSANQGVTQSSGNTFPSPLGSFFISTLSYGNLSGHRENLHFAV